MRSLLLITSLLIFFSAFPMPLSHIEADSPTVISLSVPIGFKELMNEPLEAFESQNPNIKVIVVENSGNFATPPAFGVEEHLDSVEKFVSSADVLFLDSQTNLLSPEATQAGYYLDLYPLISADETLNSGDFWPSAWQSFNWENNLWGLPISVNPRIFDYSPSAFDAAGLTYPDNNWTLQDLSLLSEQMGSKAVSDPETPPVLIFPSDSFVLVRSLFGRSFYDTTGNTLIPHFDDAELITLIDELAKLNMMPQNLAMSGETYYKIPLKIGPISDIILSPEIERQPALLFGETAGLNVSGIVVSGATRYPEAAYVLARYLASDPVAIGAFYQELAPARRDLSELQLNSFFTYYSLAEENRFLIDQAITNGFSLADMRYADYIQLASNKVRTGELTSQEALRFSEQLALQNSQIAVARGQNAQFSVAEPTLPPDLANDDTVIRFGYHSNINNGLNEDSFNLVVNDFIATDPDVKIVSMESFTPTNTNFLGEISQQYDCFYLPYNAVPILNLDSLLDLTPLMQSDPEFVENDIVGQALMQAQRDNQIWGYPIQIRPNMMLVPTTILEQLGISEDVHNWSLNDFMNALEMPEYDIDGAKINLPTDGGMSLLMLIASYGGLPIDFRYNPPIFNFTDPSTVDAIKQVLNLAKLGGMTYQELDYLNGSGRSGTAIGEGVLPIVVSSNIYEVESFGFANDGYQPMFFPTNENYIPVSYQIGMGYINRSATNPEACFRWLSEIAHHPEILSAMPANSLVLSDSLVEVQQGAELTDFYMQFADLLNNSQIVEFPILMTEAAPPASWIYTYWLYKAFDRYVLDDADLEAELVHAEDMTSEFAACAVNIRPFAVDAYNNIGEYYQQFNQCAVDIDPSLQQFLQPR